jgi:hypothetical protein
LGVYAKLQAVPRCSPFCETRAPPPSLQFRAGRHWPAAVAAAAEKQWAQIKDLAQIQIGGSYSGIGDEAYGGGGGGYMAKAFGETGQTGETGETSGFAADRSDPSFFVVSENSLADELKKHMRR